MRRLISTRGLLVLAALFVSSAALAGWGGKHEKGMGGPGMGPWMLQKLNLTDAQKQQVDKLHATFKDRTQAVREQLEQKRQEMGTLWKAANPDRLAILALQASTDRLRSQIQEAMVDMRLETLKLLTPEQRTKLNEFMQKGPRMGRRGGGGPGMMGDCPCHDEASE